MHSTGYEHRPLLLAAFEVGYRDQFYVIAAW